MLPLKALRLEDWTWTNNCVTFRNRLSKRLRLTVIYFMITRRLSSGFKISADVPMEQKLACDVHTKTGLEQKLACDEHTTLGLRRQF